MPPEEHAALVAELFKSAAELEPQARRAFLDERCPSNAEMRAEIESLLRTHGRAERFMERPALQLAARTMGGNEELQAGQAAGDYEIISVIGKGGMGEVYLAHDRQLGRRVALKLIRRGMNTDDIVRRFHHEQRLLAGLNHPNIAQLYDAGVTAEGVPFFAMEYVDGQRIDEYCRERKLSIEQRLALFGKVCAAVQYAHQHLVVHRDLKPSNILVTPEGEPKLLDFGIAKLLDAASSEAPEQTITMQNVMTPEYASPEHVRGDPITTASDVYSLGVLLYELLTGAKPYKIETRTPAEIGRVIAEVKPQRPSTAAAKVAGNAKFGPSRTGGFRNSRFLKGDLDNIVLMAMRKEPQRRYPSAAQLGADIRRHLDGLPVTARKDTLAYRSSKFIRRNRLAVAAAVLVLISIIAGLVVALWQAEQARAQRDLAQREKSKAERINQFLQTMLSFSNQSVTSVLPVGNRKEVTVNEMLDQIAPRIETELADEPDVRAQVLRTMGSAYASQGLYDQAEKHLRGALDTQTRLYGEAHAEVASTRLELGVLTYRRMQLDEAARLLESAVSFYRQRQQGPSPDYSAAHHALALDYLGVVRIYQADVKGGLALLHDALQLSSGANLSPHERGIVTFNKSDLGGALLYFGDQNKGYQLINEAIIEYQAMPGPPRWELGGALTLRGTAELNRGRLDEAERDIRQGEAILRQTLGDPNFYLAGNLNQQAVLLLRRKQFDAAEQKAREALQMFQTINRTNKFVWANSYWTLADIILTSGRASEAEPFYREALTIYEQQPKRNHLLTVPLKLTLSSCLLTQSRFDEATRLAGDAREESREHLGEQSPLTKKATDLLDKVSQARPKSTTP